MFEHFGIKDIISGLWKFKYWIVLGTIVLGVIGRFLFTSNITADEKEEYYFSQTWYFKQIEDVQQENEKNYAQVFNGLLEADVCKEFVKAKVLEKYTEEEALEILGQTGSQNGLTWEILTKSVTHLVVEGNEAVSLGLKTPNEEFGKVLANAYDSLIQYLGMKVEKTDNLEIVNLGLAEEIYKVTATGMEKDEATLLGAMLGFVLTCIIVFFICLWFPTINRKSDFDEYGLVVLGKIREV